MAWTVMEKFLPEQLIDVVNAVDEEIKKAVSSSREKDWFINTCFMLPMLGIAPFDLEIGHKCCVLTLIFLNHAYRNLPANYPYLYYGGMFFRFVHGLHFIGCTIRALKIIVGLDDKEFGSLPADIQVSFGFFIVVDYAFFLVEPSQSMFSRMLRHFQNWTETDIEALIYLFIGVICIPILFLVLFGAMTADNATISWLIILGFILIVVNLRGTQRYLFVKSKTNELYRSLVFQFSYVVLLRAALLDDFSYGNIIGKIFDALILYLIGKVAASLEVPEPKINSTRTLIHQPKPCRIRQHSI
ncbi:hypothetical protein CAEBREN_04387 [Caenorhabditis brenneri]|uniref:Uncharacterized protein n=1 Tax=Caenorhabditis brenneri TaxID=135651 RepID=G0MGL8_CAEBE|nr:hypothetical protein CAEBREN_04387 [Caenorhabditis brenneri]